MAKSSPEISKTHSGRTVIPLAVIDFLEDFLHSILGFVLFVISVFALGFTLYRVFTTHPFFPNGMIQAINDVLFIVIILEILRTVIARFTDGIFQLDKFLIIGVIAAVRHILTVGASLTLESQKTDEYFQRAILELGVNSGVVVALVFALFLSKSMQKSK